MRKGCVSKLALRAAVFTMLLLEGLLAQLPAPANRYWEAPPEWSAQPEMPLVGKQSGLLGDALKGWICIYQKTISTQDLPSCVFHPSCSRFALAALSEFGSVKGYLLTADRLLRCNPFAYFYYPFDGEKFVDPVSTYRFEPATVTAAREGDR